MEPLEALQEWYARACDGNWEHSLGVKIDTLDNPGWTVSIDIEETPMEGRVCDLEQNFDEGEWLHVTCDGKVFRAACGPRSLDRAIGTFVQFADQETD